VPVLRELIAAGKPIFGICLGHQMLALALGGRTYKLDKGHRGANHPVRDEKTGKVEITSQNHGFVIDPDSLPGEIGATGSAVAEVCFNTALTGYEEILTDPSYAGQIVTFTFPHIGNVGTNAEDIEDLNPAARAGAVGAIFKANVTDPSNYRAAGHLDQWLKKRGIVALSGIDTRALTVLIREKGMPNAVIAHAPDGVFDLDDLKQRAAAWSGLIGLDLAKEVTSGQSSVWRETPWIWNKGFSEQDEPSMHVVAMAALLSGAASGRRDRSRSKARSGISQPPRVTFSCSCRYPKTATHFWAT